MNGGTKGRSVVCVCVCVCFMVAPSSHAAEAVAKHGKENMKVYLDGCSTYYAITTHIKLNSSLY